MDNIGSIKLHIIDRHSACRLHTFVTHSSFFLKEVLKYFYLLFTRASICVSSVIAVARCLSVRLSVTLVPSIHKAEDIIKLLARPGSPVTLVL